MTTRSRQQGITLIGFIFVLAVAGFFAYIIMRLFPVYTEYFSLVRVMNETAAEANVGTKTPDQIREMMDRKMYISYISTVKKKDIIVQRENGIYRMRVKYEVRGPLIYNLDYVASFDHAVNLVNGPG
jgi:Tfp pilus assembly protein PilE